MKLRTALLAGVASLVASTAAFAADLPTRKEPPAPMPVVTPWSWTGFYIGGYVGGSFGSANWNDPVFGGTSNSNTQGGFVGGGLVGYNYQINQFVLGIEGEYGYNGTGSNGISTSGTVLGNGPLAGPFSVTQKFNDTGVARVRGRLGYAVQPQMLLYVAGGWTWMSTNSSLSGFCCGNPIANSFSVSQHQSIDGWNIGVGGEYAFTPNWIARVEYIYDGFSKLNVGYGVYPGLVDNRNVGINLNTIRAAIEYKF